MSLQTSPSTTEHYFLKTSFQRVKYKASESLFLQIQNHWSIRRDVDKPLVTPDTPWAMGTLSKNTPDNKDDKAAPSVAQQLNKAHNRTLEANGYQRISLLFCLLRSSSPLFFCPKASPHRCLRLLTDSATHCSLLRITNYTTEMIVCNVITFDLKYIPFFVINIMKCIKRHIMPGFPKLYRSFYKKQ